MCKTIKIETTIPADNHKARQKKCRNGFRAQLNSEVERESGRLLGCGEALAGIGSVRRIWSRDRLDEWKRRRMKERRVINNRGGRCSEEARQIEAAGGLRDDVESWNLRDWEWLTFDRNVPVTATSKRSTGGN